MNVQRYKVGYYSDEWGVISNTPCLLKDNNGYAVKFEDYEQLRQRVQELEKELAAKTHRVSIPTNTMEQWAASEIRRVANPLKEQIIKLTAERDALVEAATMAVEMIEYDKHERRHVRWKLQDAIASVKEK